MPDLTPRERNAIAQRLHRERHPEKAAEYTAKWRYGITADGYDRLFSEQNGRCAICNEVESANDRFGRTRVRLSVDHDHLTGRIRALLCHRCNTALGNAKDDPALLRQMADYLERSAP